MRVFDIDINRGYPMLESAHKAVLTAYIPSALTECGVSVYPAVLIFPGGGYRFVSQREAEPIAAKFLSYGFAAFVLKYSAERDAAVPYPVQLRQAAAAMDHIRANARELGVFPDKIAVCGFSAGGHLAASISTLYGREEAASVARGRNIRPDASILCYPVITSDVRFRHEGSVLTIAGEDERKQRSLSAELNVTADTPPAFIWHTADDKSVHSVNSLLYAQKLAENNIPYELHIYRSGRHGLSTAENMLNANLTEAEKLCAEWVSKSARFLQDVLK